MIVATLTYRLGITEGGLHFLHDQPRPDRGFVDLRLVSAPSLLTGFAPGERKDVDIIVEASAPDDVGVEGIIHVAIRLANDHFSLNSGDIIKATIARSGT